MLLDIRSCNSWSQWPFPSHMVESKTWALPALLLCRKPALSDLLRWSSEWRLSCLVSTPKRLPEQSVCTSASRILQSVWLNWLGVRVRINFQVSLQCQCNAALLVWNHSPLLLAMGERLKRFQRLQALVTSGSKKSPWSKPLQVFLRLSTSESSQRVIVSPLLVFLPRFFGLIFQISP